MDCYFGSKSLPENNDLKKSAVVAFFIPELGIKFKAPFDAVNPDHSDFASLLALLEFIDTNPKYFKDKAYKIFGDNHSVVAQINRKQPFNVMFSPLMKKALQYREKHNFSLRCVGDGSDPDYEALFD